MIWDKKYRPWIPEIICPVCKKRIDRQEWDDFGMHFECTEYYLSGRYFKEKADHKKESKVHAEV